MRAFIPQKTQRNRDFHRQSQEPNKNFSQEIKSSCANYNNAPKTRTYKKHLTNIFHLTN